MVLPPGPLASESAGGILAAFFANRFPVGLSENPNRERRPETKKNTCSRRPRQQGPKFLVDVKEIVATEPQRHKSILFRVPRALTGHGAA